MTTPIPSTMLALHLTKPSNSSSPPTLTLTTLPIPTPQPNSVLIKVHASAIQPSDILNSHNAFPFTTFPRVPGRDFSGTIISSPSNSSLIGQEIYGTSGNSLSFTSDGAHAEYIIVPENAVAVKPKNLSWKQACLVGVPFTTAMLAVKRAGVREGERVLVLGAKGSVGSAAVQLCSNLGAKVLKGVRGAKAENEVDTSSSPPFEGLEGEIDVVIDTVGQPALTSAAAKKLGRGGRLVFIAAPRDGKDDVLGVEMLDFYRKEKVLIGVNTLLYGVETFVEEMREMRGLFEEGKLSVEDGGWTEVGLKDGVEAYGRKEKVVLVMD